jgi:glycosyltransferase involved in cell wall biosynthesis
MNGKRIFGALDPFFEGGGYLGRSAANAGFLQALLEADPFDEYHFFLPSLELGQELRERAAGIRPGLADKILATHRLDLAPALEKHDFYCFHCSDCINHPAHLARLRNLLSRHIFPVTSVTHSLCYASYNAAFLAHLWPGCTPRDAVVATSRAGRSAVLGYYASLRDAYGLSEERFKQPQVELIPLGIRLRDFPLPDAEAKAAARQALELEPERIVLLVFGRLDHASKLDPLPLLRAVQRIGRGEAGPAIEAKRFCLLLAGGSAGGSGGGDEQESEAARLAGAAANLGLDLVRVANPDEAKKRLLFAAADVFVSPVDNLQETFGLALLEAGAMGLPSVVSDYDGYRDIVVHGRTGFLAPTLGPPPDPDFDAFAALAFDNQSLLRYAQQTVVDVGALAQGIAALARSPELRRAMGQAARARVEQSFGWGRVLDEHLALWARLWEAQVESERLRDIAHPLQTEYGRVFAAHPSRVLDQDMLLRWSVTGKAVQQGREFYLTHGGVAGMLDHEALKRLAFFARKPATAGSLARRLIEETGLDADAARFHILWALKHDLLECAGSTAPA